MALATMELNNFALNYKLTNLKDEQLESHVQLKARGVYFLLMYGCNSPSIYSTSSRASLSSTGYHTMGFKV